MTDPTNGRGDGFTLGSAVRSKHDREAGYETVRTGRVARRSYSLNSDKVCILVNGNKVPGYYPKGEWEVLEGAAELLSAAQANGSQSFEQPPITTPDPVGAERREPQNGSAGRLGGNKRGFSIPNVDQDYEGDLDLSRLNALRDSIADDLRKLDEAILLLRVQVMLKRSLRQVAQEREIAPRAEIASDAIKIRADTAKALAAANRLAARGVL